MGGTRTGITYLALTLYDLKNGYSERSSRSADRIVNASEFKTEPHGRVVG
jgi:hypothetical protein